jgi:hypothetical protein
MAEFKTDGNLTAKLAASIKPLLIVIRDFKMSWFIKA